MVARLLLGLFVAAGTVSHAQTSPAAAVASWTVMIGQGSVETAVPVQLSPPQGQEMKAAPERQAAIRLLHGAIANRRAVNQPNAALICGLKIMRVDPNFDPGIHKQLSERALDAKIRRVPPTLCRSDTSANRGDQTASFAVEAIKPPKR